MARRKRDKSNAALSPRESPDANAPVSLPLAPSPRWHVPLAAALIALAAIAVYWNSFSGVFDLDDGGWITENTSVHQLWPISHVLFPREKVELVGGRPVVSLTLALNYSLGGEHVWGYHLVNLAIHILAAWTLFGLIRRTLLLPAPSEPALPSLPNAADGSAKWKSRFAAAATPLALAATLLWTVHPIQTGAVTYIIQRTESLVSLFYLLTLYCVLRGATASRGAASWAPRAWYLAAALSCALGMGTKEVMATAPLVVLLYDRIFLSGSFRAALARRWGLYLVLVASTGIIVWGLLFTHFHGESTATNRGLFTRWTYLLTESQVLAHYLRMVFWPTGQAFDYDWPPVHSLKEVIWPGLLIVALLGLTVWALVTRPRLGFLGAWFFLILAPTSSFFPILDAAWDYRMYLPLAAIAVGIALAGYALVERFAVPRAKSAAVWIAPAAALAVATIALGVATVRRNEVYHSDRALWQDVVDKCPMNPRGHASLGLALQQEDKIDEAIAQFNKAIDIYNQAIGTPIPSRAHYFLASLMLEHGQNEKAAYEYQLAEALEPHDAQIQFFFGMALQRIGNLPEAVRHWREAMRLDPGNTKYRYALAWVLATTSNSAVRDGREAIELAQRGIELTEGKNPTMFDALAAGYAETGQFSQAVQTAQQALELAIQQKNDKVANGVRIHLHLYESELPYREP